MYSLITHDCVAKHDNNNNILFVDDTTVIGLISDSVERVYRRVVEDLTSGHHDNDLYL